MQLSVGLGELLTAFMSMIGIGWGILRISFSQFEKRIDAKFNTIERLELDIKRVEVDGIRSASQFQMLFVTKEELSRAQEKHDKTMERVFGILQTINDKLDKKVDRDECEKMMLRKEQR
jgi:hypothetical protein